MKEIIQRVRINQYNKQKLITIPKDCDIEEGDYVLIKKVVIK